MFILLLLLCLSHTFFWPQKKYARKLSQRLRVRRLSNSFITVSFSLKTQNSLRSDSWVFLTWEKNFHSALQRFRKTSSGNASIYSEAKASVKLPRHEQLTTFVKLGRDKCLSIYIYQCDTAWECQSLCRAERRRNFGVKKMQLFERSEFCIFNC